MCMFIEHILTKLNSNKYKKYKNLKLLNKRKNQKEQKNEKKIIKQNGKIKRKKRK